MPATRVSAVATFMGCSAAFAAKATVGTTR